MHKLVVNLIASFSNVPSQTTGSYITSINGQLAVICFILHVYGLVICKCNM